MSFFPSLSPPPSPPPPSFYATTNGGMDINTQPQQTYDDDTSINNAGFTIDTYSSSTSSSSSSSSYSSTSVTSSIIIISIVISSAIIISASIYILLRFLSRRTHRRYASADDVVHNNTINPSSSPSSNQSDYNTLDSLPVFTFGSLNGNLTSGDCAVCLSKFKKEDQLRLLPLCCHAFHTHCIDAWLLSNQTCPLCRSTVYPTETDVLNKVLSVTENMNNSSNINGVVDTSSSNGSSFRVEIGSISRRRGASDGGGRRSYSVGSFEYIVGEGYEIPMESISIHRRGESEVTVVDKDSPPGERLEAEVGGGGGGGGSGRNWLRDYVDRLGSISSFRSSGRFFTGSSRRSDVIVPVNDDLEEANNRAGEDISELFRWISGV